MVESDIPHAGDKLPSCKSQDLGAVFPVIPEAEHALLKTCLAVKDEHKGDDDGHQEGQDAVPDELVSSVKHQQEDDGQFQEHFQDTRPGEKIHPLMGDDAGIIRDADEGEDQGKDRELVNPSGGHHPVRRNGQFVADKPKPDRLGQDDDQDDESDVDGEGRLEDASGNPGIVLSQSKGEETGRGVGHGPHHERTHRHHAGNHVVEAIIDGPQLPEKDTGHVK